MVEFAAIFIKFSTNLLHLFQHFDMEKKTISFEYQIIPGLDELESNYRALLEKAGEALKEAYAPYSEFKVGASLVDAEGHIFTGANMENASYPMCICAEGALLTAYNTSGSKAPILAVAITATSSSHVVDHPVAPCGACRQMLSEMEMKQGQPIRLILQGSEGPVYIIDKVSDVLPLGFSGEEL